MQTSDERSKSLSPGLGRAPRMVGGVAVIGLIFLSTTSWLSCAPGKLDCSEFPNLCAGGGGGGDTADAAAGSGGAGAKDSGAAGGGGGGGGGTTPTAATPVNCTKYPTLGDMDKFFALRCATTGACHGASSPWTDMKAPDFWKKMLDAPAKFTCMGKKIIDKTTPANSLILLKTKNMKPMCPGGGDGMAQMPTVNDQMIPTPLPADEITCLENFVNAAAGK